MEETTERLNPTRNLMLRYMANITKRKGIVPHRAMLGIGTWLLLAEDFLPYERYVDGRKTRIDGGAYLEIAGIPFYSDPRMEEGTVVFVHSTDPDVCGEFSGLESRSV